MVVDGYGEAVGAVHFGSLISGIFTERRRRLYRGIPDSIRFHDLLCQRE